MVKVYINRFIRRQLSLSHRGEENEKMVVNGVNQGASAQAWEGARKVKSDMRVSWQRQEARFCCAQWAGATYVAKKG